MAPKATLVGNLPQLLPLRQVMDGPYYLLNPDGSPVPTTDLKAVERLLADGAARTVAITEHGNVKISTVFLTIDHNHTPGSPPLLWETAVFGGSDRMCRYSSLEQAREGHQRMAQIELRQSIVPIEWGPASGLPIRSRPPAVEKIEDWDEAALVFDRVLEPLQTKKGPAT